MSLYVGSFAYPPSIPYRVGQDIEIAVKNTLTVLDDYDNHEECTLRLNKAQELSVSNLSDAEAITQLDISTTERMVSSKI